jgi:pimeloyl-ACP methyl ester carboxylesterase
VARASLVAVAAAAVLLLAGWSSAGVPRWTHWLCFPGAANDWCAVDLPTVVVGPNDVPRFETVSVPASPPVDCFYVYPTVSEAASGNAPLKLQEPEKDAAIIQAAYFSKVCRVYAPLYRQTTGSYTHTGNPALAYADVLAAWRDYLAHDNHGRGVVLIGHSQGAGVLERLIESQIDTVPAVRKLLVSAILLGGEVSVRKGSTAGGSFRHVPACTSATETGCVIAYEAWNGTPPTSWSGPSSAGQATLCTNPGALGGGSGAITPIFPGLNSEGIVPPGSRYLRYQWVEFTGLYRARCVSKGNRSWLLVTRIHHPGDTRPTVQANYGTPHELHPADVNIALANFIWLVQSETAAWTAHH